MRKGRGVFSVVLLALVAGAGLSAAQVRMPQTSGLDAAVRAVPEGVAVQSYGFPSPVLPSDRLSANLSAQMDPIARTEPLPRLPPAALQEKLDRKTAGISSEPPAAHSSQTKASIESNRSAKELQGVLTARPTSDDLAGEWGLLFDGLDKVALKDILDVAASPSSKRIAGWRKADFDAEKKRAVSAMEEDPSISLASLAIRPISDVGPSLDEIPPLVPALARIAARYVKGKSDIRRVVKLPRGIQDYAIIGAGMAAVSAGAVIADANRAGAGLRGVLLEAGTAVGGRARDVEVNGTKVGLGASWLHGRYNMLRRLADLLGLTRERTFLGKDVYVDGWRLNEEEKQALFREEEAADAAMLKAGDAALHGARETRDGASKFFPDGKWKQVAEAEKGPGDEGMEAGRIDVIDGARFQSDQDDFIKEGMQEFVTRIAQAAELPVAFNSQAKRVVRGEDGIWTVTLRDGRSVRARQVIYTGSTGALAGIDFGTDLPRVKADAAKALPMGNFTKFLFTTSEPLGPGTSKNSWVVDAETDPKTGKLRENVQFVVKYNGDPTLNIMFTGGRMTDKVLALSDAERTAYVEKKFAKIAGRPVRAEIKAVTPFGSDPFFKGSYSNLAPGYEGAHTAYAAPVRGLHFAGEAAGTAQNNQSLLAAFTSGIDSAYDAIAALRLPSERSPSR